jgi:hypothetical protein
LTAGFPFLVELPPLELSLYIFFTLAKSVRLAIELSVKGKGSPSTFAVMCVWILEGDTDGAVVVSEVELGGSDTLIIKREVVAGVMPKRRKDSAIYFRRDR